MRFFYRIALIYINCIIFTGTTSAQTQVVLNGKWEAGYHRRYNKQINVPGLADNPAKVNPDTLWLRRQILLPKGSWNSASLVLKGARFCPSVYINGQFVARGNGGMAPIFRKLNHKDLRPGQNVLLEIALLPLDKVPFDDASKIPAADLWRSNVSSGIWDDVVLHLHKRLSIKSIISQSDIKKDEAIIHYETEGLTSASKQLEIKIADQQGKELLSTVFPLHQLKGKLRIPLHQKLKFWAPETPVLYKLTATLKDGNSVSDVCKLNFGHKQFMVNGLQFQLNGEPVKLRAASVVWHRWVRDPEASQLAWDEKWFEQNIVKRLKNLGANTLRFHLGLPPDKLLDLCDRYGLMVQSEWSFFHGMKASETSLKEQWPAWFEASLKHPSVVLMHGWNETEGEEELKTAFNAINQVAKHYGPLVIGHRDVIHVHKYWWSLFENLGLYYDSYKQFPMPIMVDEFGGNYLDGKGDIGRYPTNAASFMRFLGRNSKREERLDHHTLSNAQVAEYWRRIGAAGFSPFCAIGSPEDGNNWFLGPLKEGNPKPVWAALAAAYSPVSVSLEIWNRHYVPGEKLTIDAYLFNDTQKPQVVNASFKIIDPLDGDIKFEQAVSGTVAAFSHSVKPVLITLPNKLGNWRLVLELNNPPASLTYPVKSV